MSSTSNYLLTIVSKQITIYLGISTLIAGVVGGILNIIVFLSLKTFRQSSCAFFLTIMSFVNIGQLMTSLFSRILITGFNLDWTEKSVAFCKFRSYFLQACALISYTCVCLATIDQFLATSLRPRWQNYMTIRRGHIICLTFVILWFLHGIPSLIWYSPVISPRTGSFSCSITHNQYQSYNSYCNLLVLSGILPIIITVVFGTLAYRNVRQIPYRTVPLVRRELDKQLTSMVLVQVVYSVIVTLPYVITLLTISVASFTITSPSYVPIIFSNIITGMIQYFHFASPFYIYMCVSKRFRQQFLYVFTGFFTKPIQSNEIGSNRIAPMESFVKISV